MSQSHPRATTFGAKLAQRRGFADMQERMLHFLTSKTGAAVVA